MGPATRRGALLYGGAALLCTIAVGGRVLHNRLVASRPYARLSANQVLDRTEAVCRKVSPSMVGMRIDTSRASSHDATGRVRRFWNSECSSVDSPESAFLWWDADSGELASVAWVSSKPETPTDIKHPLTRSEAVGVAAHWLNVLGVQSMAPRWRLESADYRDPFSWFIRWRAADRDAVMWIRASDGGLRTLQVVPKGLYRDRLKQPMELTSI